MKKIYNISGIALISTLLFGCVTSNVPYAYDDLYYSPSNDPVQQVQKNTTEDLNRTNNIQYQGGYDNRYSNTEDASDNRQGVYQNRYTNQEQAENNQPISNQAEVAEQEYSDEYYDEDYAQTLQRINSPVRNFNTYDPYQRDRILYTQNPIFVTPSVYGGYQFWDPFVPTTGLSVGWNSFSGWNVGVNFGYGIGLGCAPLNPYYGFYDPFWGVGYGFNSWNWGYNWGWGSRFYNPYNRFGYASGYHHGYRNGYNNGRYDNYYGYNNTSSGRRQITAPRGSNGSRNVYTGNGNQVTRPTRGGKSGVKTVDQPSNTAVPNGSTRPTRGTPTSTPKTTVEKPVNERPTSPTPVSNRPVRNTTPERYKTPSTPSSYSRPRGETTPSRTTTTPSTTVRPSAPTQQQTRPNYSNPRQNNTYNRPTVTPRQPQTRPSRTETRPQQPAQQSRPTYNNDRSRPTYNRTTPTYSAPRNSGGGGGSRGGGSTRPSRR